MWLGWHAQANATVCFSGVAVRLIWLSLLEKKELSFTLLQLPETAGRR